MAKTDHLTNKQRLFVDAYLETWNATESARRAGYKGNDNTLAAVGKENLSKPQIAKLISARLSASAMTADEVIKRLAEQARVNIAEAVKEEKLILTTSKGDVIEIPSFGLNWEWIKENGHLVKSITATRSGPKIELYDAQNALQLLGKAHGLFTERVDMTTHGEQVQVVLYLPENGREAGRA